MKVKVKTLNISVIGAKELSQNRTFENFRDGKSIDVTQISNFMQRPATRMPRYRGAL